MTSNVGQNYPYTSETRGRSRRDGRPARLRTGRSGRDAERRSDSARRERAVVGLEVPDAGLSGPPPRCRVRRREARRLRRLRRDLRQDLPALNDTRPAEPAEDLAASRRRVLVDGAGIAVSALGFGFVYGLSAREAGFSPIEAMAMSVIVFGGAAQFAAVGYVASGLAWPGDRAADRTAERPPPALLRCPRAVAARGAVRPSRGDGPSADRRVVRAVDRPLPAARADRRVGLLDRRGRLHVHPLEPRDPRRRRSSAARSPTRPVSASTSSSRRR